MGTTKAEITRDEMDSFINDFQELCDLHKVYLTETNDGIFFDKDPLSYVLYFSTTLGIYSLDWEWEPKETDNV